MAIKFSLHNGKLVKAGKELGVKQAVFGLLAGHTCPAAGTCKAMIIKKMIASKVKRSKVIPAGCAGWRSATDQLTDHTERINTMEQTIVKARFANNAVHNTPAYVGQTCGHYWMLYKDESTNNWKGADLYTGWVFKLWNALERVTILDKIEEIQNHITDHTVHHAGMLAKYKLAVEHHGETVFINRDLVTGLHFEGQGLNTQERTEHAQMTEACIAAESALTYAVFDGQFDDARTLEQIKAALQQVRDVLKLAAS